MASERLFEDIAPFPDDIPTAEIATISLKHLLSNDEATTKSLFTACQRVGFFLLDLHDDPLGDSLIKEVDELFNVTKELMDLPSDVKEKYLHNLPKSFLGFKPRGTAKTETNDPDRFEWFNLGQDGLLGNTALQPVPDVLHARRSLLTSFLRHGQVIVSAISKCLAEQLSLPESAFAALQDPAKASGTVIRMIKADSSPTTADLRTSMIHHTDFGTITLLANVLGGLQILSPDRSPEDADAWRYVRPKPGCLIVNLGDAMVQWTGGLLRSNVHRVSFAPGEQRFAERYSLALLVRPEKNASMQRLVEVEGSGTDDGAGMTAWEWEVAKTVALRRGDTATGKEATPGFKSIKSTFLGKSYTN